MRWSTLSLAALLCIPGASYTPHSPNQAIHRRYDYNPFRAGYLAPRQEEPTIPTANPTTEPGAGETSVPTPPEVVISEDGLCGNVTTCAGSTFGRCCSDFYWCGNDEAYCGDGCREEFGSCGEAPEEPEPELEDPPQSELDISSDGTCGNGTTCAGSGFGGCCSWYFWCGDDEAYCGDSCRSEFGSCDEPGLEEPPQMELEISTTGMCGNGTTCAGSEYGGCCSWWFWCGSGADFCAGDCRSEFGECQTATEE